MLRAHLAGKEREVFSVSYFLSARITTLVTKAFAFTFLRKNLTFQKNTFK